MPTKTFPHLIAQVEAATAGLDDIQRKRMFGCDGFFAGDEIFALLWKTERIGVKITDAAAFERLMAAPGSEPWRAGPKAMAHWVLTPPSFHEDLAALEPWVRLAYGLAREAPTRSSSAAAKSTSSATPRSAKTSAAESSGPAKRASAAKGTAGAKGAAAAGARGAAGAKGAAATKGAAGAKRTAATKRAAAEPTAAKTTRATRR
ncbi:MAG: TfoX/Sxy family protein [Nannocystaceae bacterium]